MLERAPAATSSTEPTTDDAKADLLAWSERADEELLAKVQELVGAATSGVRKAAPWAAGAALIGGLLLRKRRKRRRERGEEDAPSSIASIVSILRVAIGLVPVILPLLKRRRD